MSDVTEIVENMARINASERDACSWVNATHRTDGIDLATNLDKVLRKSKLHDAKKRHLTKAAGAFFFDGKTSDILNMGSKENN